MATPLQVVSRKGEAGEQLIKRFMKKVRNEGVIKDFLDRTSCFEKPSVKKRKKRSRLLNRQS